MAKIHTRDGTKLYAKDWGEGRPVILIHGWPLSADSWDPQAKAIADAGMRAIFYDRRGFGRSDQPFHGYDYDTFADDLADVMQEKGVTEDAALVGFSMGGGEIARYMSKYQGKGVTQAALVSSVVPYMLQTSDNPDGVPQATFDQMTAGMTKDRAHFFAGFLKDFYGVGILSHPVSAEMVQMSWNVAMQASYQATLKAAEAFATTDFRPDMASFKVPTLVIHGTADKTVPIDPTGRKAVSMIPGAQLIEYDGSPHGVFGTDSDRFTADLLNFLQQGSSKSAFGFDDRESDTSTLRSANVDYATATSATGMTDDVGRSSSSSAY